MTAAQPDRARRRRRGGAAGRRRLRRELREPPRAGRAAGRAAHAAGQPAGDAARRARSRAARRRARATSVPTDGRHRLRPLGRWLSKPLRGGGGIGVREWRDGALQGGTFLQERIDGIPCSAAAVGNGIEAVVLGLTEQLVGRARVRRPRPPLVRGTSSRRACRPATGCSIRRARPAPAWRPRSRCGACSASTSCGTASARGRSRSIHVRPRRSRRSRRRTAWMSSPLTSAAAPVSCRASNPGVPGAAGKAVLFATERRGSSPTAASAGWSAASATSRIRASASPRAIRSARSWPPLRRRVEALASLEEQSARLRTDLRVEVGSGG